MYVYIFCLVICVFVVDIKSQMVLGPSQLPALIKYKAPKKNLITSIGCSFFCR